MRLFRWSFMAAGLFACLATSARAELYAGWQSAVTAVHGRVEQKQHCTGCQSRWTFFSPNQRHGVAVALNGEQFWTWSTLNPVWVPWGRVVAGTPTTFTISRVGAEILVGFEGTSLRTGLPAKAGRRFYFGDAWGAIYGIGEVYSYTRRNSAGVRHEYVTTLPLGAALLQKGTWAPFGSPGSFFVQ